jgi:pimeloyl-ACP methyl ester carboxylesterase
MKPLLGLLAAAGLCYLLMCGYLFFAQRQLMYFPTPVREDRPHFVLSTDGHALRVATQARSGPDAVLYFGGNAEDVATSIAELAAAFPEASIFALHYRGYGGSSGEPSERALVADALALHAHVQSTHSRITLVGRSLGSGIALQLARARPVERLVLVTPFHSMRELAQHHYPAFPVRWLLQDTYESTRHATGLRVPTTVVLASHDRVIPRWSSERLLEALDPALTRVHEIPGTDHDSVSSGPGYAEALGGW